MGFPAGAATVSDAVVNRLLESVSPYAEKVEHIVDMEDFMPTVLTEEEEVKPPPSQDFESRMPFADVMAGHLFVLAPKPAKGEQDQEASSAAPPS
jgi:hypothetical protein